MTPTPAAPLSMIRISRMRLKRRLQGQHWETLGQGLSMIRISRMRLKLVLQDISRELTIPLNDKNLKNEIEIKTKLNRLGNLSLRLLVTRISRYNKKGQAQGLPLPFIYDKVSDYGLKTIWGFSGVRGYISLYQCGIPPRRSCCSGVPFSISFVTRGPSNGSRDFIHEFW